MEFNNEESDELIKNEFFIIYSDNLEAIESKLYGYMITENGIITNESIQDYLNIQNGSELSKDGSYVWVKRNGDEITIYQDFIGSYGLYMFKEDDYFAISNSFLRLVEYLKENHHLPKKYGQNQS